MLSNAPVPQSFTVQCRGLYTLPNSLSEIPEGSLTTADNVVIDRDGVVNPRRGLAIYGSNASSIVKQIMAYKGRVFRHWGTTIDYDSDGAGTFQTIGSSITEQSSGSRLKYAESNGNLYFTSNTGIQKISANSTANLSSASVTKAGGIKALDGTAALNKQTGFFTQDSTIAYRVVWGIQDANTNVILGVPSSRIVIANSMLSLLISDINSLLNNLSTAGANNSGGSFHDTSINTYILSKHATVTDVYTLLLTLSNTSSSILDADFAVSGASVTTTAGSATATMTSTTNIVPGMKISGNTNIPTGATVLSVAADGVTLTLSANATGAATTATNFTNVTFQSITPVPSAPTEPGTTADLTNLQNYYDSIVNALNNHPGIRASAKAVIGGAFLNSTQSATTTLTFSIPAGVTTAHFYQVYRSAIFSSSNGLTLSQVSPDDELFLVYESNPTSTDLTNGYITYQDITPDVFRQGGTPLYTNANSGEGSAQANYAPPLAQDMTLFNSVMFYANTQSTQYLQFNLLTALGLAGQTFTITQNSTPLALNFVATVNQITRIICIAGSAFTGTGTADYFDLHTPSNGITYRIWFQVGSSVAPSGSGVTLVQCSVLNTDTVTQVGTKLKNALTVLPDFTATNTFSGDIHAGSNIIQNIDSTSNLVVGMGITGTGIPGGTTITALTGNTATMSASATQDQIANTVTLSTAVIVANENSGACTNPSNHVVSGSFSLTVSTSGSGENAAALQVGVSNASTPAQEVDETARSLVRVINAQTASPVNAYYMSGASDVPGIIRLEARTIGESAFYLTASSPSGGTAYSPALPASGTAQGSKNDVYPNYVFWSKTQQPESVPLVNFAAVGPRDKAILRIVALRDSLFILSEAGIYQLTGTDPTNFQSTLFDGTTKLIAPDAASALNNQVCMLSDQGVVMVSSTGVQVISRAIEDQLLPLPIYNSFVSASHAVSYNSDRSFLLFTVSNPADTYATQCFRYNTFTQTWTRWPISKNCSVVEPVSEVLYVGTTDVNNVEKERKSFSRLDYADRQYDLTFSTQGISSKNTISLVSLGNMAPGDVLVQTQYLTIGAYNRLLKKLDLDTGLTFKSYFATYGAFPGDDLRARLTQIADQLDADGGTSGGYAAAISGYSSSFPDQQSAFNAVVNKLNSEANVKQHDFMLSAGTVWIEVPVTAINTYTQSATLAYTAPIIAGTLTLYNQISCKIAWAPQFFGNPASTKHVRDGTFIFRNMNFTSAQAAYGTDLLPGPTSVPITGDGTGAWGSMKWGTTQFGGTGSSRPFRTLLPLDKQRCRYVLPQFKHSAAFESFAIFGISFSFSLVSSRGYT